ncbi:hypothetical protein [Methylocapsa sp. S129]|uniref:hypothetical protein n=1 Tax=Methylocapsa sp. S129 TaxID=1641869 RepID=UPI00131EA0A4|nr:hypothetical protein [Methylocapsa sp. S129]
MSFLLRSCLVLWAVGIAAPAMAAGKAVTLCKPDELVVFSCSAGVRYASVCASKGVSKSQGTMQYRFGSPAKLELVYPAAPGKPAEDFKGGSLMFSGGGGAFLRFSNGPYEYTVFSATGKWGPNESPLDEEGVAIRKDAKEFSNFVCRNFDPAVGELGPDFLDKMGMSPADPDSDFSIPDAYFKK